MRLKRLCVAILSATLLLAGCGDIGKPQLLTEFPSHKYEVPISDNSVCVVWMPMDLVLESTDGDTYWRFTDGTSLQIFSAYLSTGAKETYVDNIMYTSDSVMHSVNGKTLIITTNSISRDAAYTAFFMGEVVAVEDCTLNSADRLTELPEYTECEDMSLNASNFYMPTEFDIDQSDSVYCDSDGFIKSWIMDGTLEENMSGLVTRVRANGDYESMKYYQDLTTLYIENDEQIIAAKQLMANEWYVYFGSAAHKDYILSGLNKVRSSR